jgi:Flp pilus assembly protein protease CpaA
MALLLALALAPPLFAACLWDVRHRLIPDWTVLWVAATGLLGAVASAVSAGSVGPLGLALGGGLVCSAISVLAARFGVWGLGDAKLFAAAGLVTGLSGLLELLFATALTGGALALLLLALRGPVRSGALALPAGAPRWLKAEQTRLRRHPTIPYAVAIATGLATALVKA